MTMKRWSRWACSYWLEDQNKYWSGEFSDHETSPRSLIQVNRSTDRCDVARVMRLWVGHDGAGTISIYAIWNMMNIDLNAIILFWDQDHRVSQENWAYGYKLLGKFVWTAGLIKPDKTVATATQKSVQWESRGVRCFMASSLANSRWLSCCRMSFKPRRRSKQENLPGQNSPVISPWGSY